MIDIALISTITLFVIAFATCRALLLRGNPTYMVISLTIGLALVFVGLGEPNLRDFSDFVEMAKNRRSRAIYLGIGCILGSACYWLIHKE